MEPLGYGIVALAAIAGVTIGWLTSRTGSRRAIAQAQEQASRQLEQARQAAALILREMEAEAREELAAFRQAEAQTLRQAEEENSQFEERLNKRETRCDAREQELAPRSEGFEAREAVLVEARDKAQAERLQAREKRQAAREALEQRAGQTAEQVKEGIVEGMVEETRAQCADRLRNLEATSNEEFMRRAKRTMGISMGRYSGHFLTERLASSLTLGTEGAARLRAAPAALSELEQLTGIRFSLPETGEVVRFEGGDGTARELARRTLTRFLAEENVRDLPGMVSGIAADLDREILALGNDAFRKLGLKPAHTEIVKLLGRLNFRTSYTQNQWRHAIESAILAGLMAAELGLDVKTARRATLLHDIGKALSHELEGSHAVIGADYARRLGEEELVANAVGSHHGDEPARSPYAYLVAAADAMSGARPGARREMVETYVDRISDLESIASGFQGVVQVHAVQAGRELRVHVDEARVNDARAAKLSEEIASKISESMTFPGQIRVTVIREFKAIEIAS
jgi:ribonuclease Y